jgi:hypothetical protein
MAFDRFYTEIQGMSNLSFGKARAKQVETVHLAVRYKFCTALAVRDKGNRGSCWRFLPPDKCD